MIPKDGIMLTYSNKHTFPFIGLQRRAMDVGGIRKCMEQRFITACLDSGCARLCRQEGIPNCVLLQLPHIPYGANKSKRKSRGQYSYSFVTWLKHELMYESLKVAGHVFFFDADVVILRNPWPETLYGRDELGNRISGIYDAMYQKDRGLHYKNCAESANSGIVYFRNSSQYHDNYYPLMLSKKNEIIISETGKLDQDYMGELIDEAKLKYCAFPSNKMSAACLESGHSKLQRDEIITYHAACAKDVDQKLSFMKVAIQAFSGNRVNQ